MAHTCLAFYRKSQDLESLATERPKSLDWVHKVLKEAVDKVHGKLALLEQNFYARKKCEDDIWKIRPKVLKLMEVSQTTYIHAAWQINEIYEKSTDPHVLDRIALDEDTVQTVKDYQDKILFFVPTEFADVIEDMSKILFFLQKYCQSFCKGKTDPYLETVRHYELKLQDLGSAIEMHANNITDMADAYRNHSGLSAKMFGLTTNELARRCDVGNLPFLLMFPQACENVRHALKGVLQWVDADENYATFIKVDISQLEKRREVHGKIIRDMQVQTFKLEHQFKTLKKDVSDLTKELFKLKSREDALQNDVEDLVQELRYAQMDIDFREEQREQIKEQAKETDPMSFHEKYEKLTTEIKDLRHKIPDLKREIEQANCRMSWITQKRKQLGEKQVAMDDIQSKWHTSKKSLDAAEEEMVRIHKCLQVLRDVYLQKTSPDAMKKIFHNMPVELRNIRLIKKRGVRKSKTDALDRASRVVASSIDGDWKDFYRNLPFHPPRGDINVDDDLDDIVKDRFRKPEPSQIQQGLARWRRNNTRASLSQLKSTLKDMQKPEIIQEIDERLQQVRTASPVKRTKPHQKRRRKKKSLEITYSLPKQSRLTLAKCALK